MVCWHIAGFMIVCILQEVSSHSRPMRSGSRVKRSNSVSRPFPVDHHLPTFYSTAYSSQAGKSMPLTLHDTTDFEASMIASTSYHHLEPLATGEFGPLLGVFCEDDVEPSMDMQHPMQQSSNLSMSLIPNDQSRPTTHMGALRRLSSNPQQLSLQHQHSQQRSQTADTNHLRRAPVAETSRTRHMFTGLNVQGHEQEWRSASHGTPGSPRSAPLSHFFSKADPAQPFSFDVVNSPPNSRPPRNRSPGVATWPSQSVRNSPPGADTSEPIYHHTPPMHTFSRDSDPYNNGTTQRMGKADEYTHQFLMQSVGTSVDPPDRLPSPGRIQHMMMAATSADSYCAQEHANTLGDIAEPYRSGLSLERVSSMQDALSGGFHTGSQHLLPKQHSNAAINGKLHHTESMGEVGAVSSMFDLVPSQLDVADMYSNGQDCVYMHEV